MPLLHGQCRLPHIWLCELGSTSENPMGTAARVGYTYCPCMPTVLMVLGLVPPHMSCQEVLAPDEWSWVWREQEWESTGEGGCGEGRAILGSERISHGGQREGRGKRGKDSQEDEFANSVRVGWLITGKKIMERQKWSEKKMLTRK